VLQRFKAYLHAHGLIQAGDRVAVAVSGGADSVALLRILLELREHLGIILSVAHFNHKIRGADADADEQFVRELATKYALDLHLSSGDAPAEAALNQQSLETAARNLRYAFFRELLASRKVDNIATAHSMDDQAETVLMRLLRGAGTRGLAGIYPAYSSGESVGAIIRPLLEFRRAELREYLEAHKQPWREDSTNSDLHHTRNSIRQELLPLLSEKYNPNIVETLARTAEVARSEEEHWANECRRLLPLLLLPGKPVRGGGRAVSTDVTRTFGLSIALLKQQTEALQRRVIRSAALSFGLILEMEHVVEVLKLLGPSAKASNLPDGWRATKGLRELRFERSDSLKKPQAVTFRAHGPMASAGYSYSLPVPGQVKVPEINSVVRTLLLPLSEEKGRYNHSPSGGGSSGYAGVLVVGEAQLQLRNWRVGDRFWPAHSGSKKKVKELLQDMKVEQAGRKLWPVVVAGKEIIWVQGTHPRRICVERDGLRHSLSIEVQPLN
jgi:tRNA(Ile)-lysidine synthase